VNGSSVGESTASSDRLGQHDDRPVHVRADLHVAAVLPFVHALVHVADDRVGDLAGGPGEQADRADADHLVHGRGERQPGPGQRGDLGGPDAAADHHVLGRDLALAGDHPGDPFADGADVEHLRAGDHGQRPRRQGLLAHQGARAERVDDADGGEVAAAEDDRRVEVGDQLLHPFGGEDLGRDAPGLGLGGAAAQLLHPLLGPGDLDAAGLGEHAQRLVLLARVPGELEHQPRVLDREDEVGRVPGRAARVGQRPLVQQDDVPPAEQRQVVDEAVADDARANDHGARAGRPVSHGVSRLVILVERSSHGAG
jgi:hypothetical protein